MDTLGFKGLNERLAARREAWREAKEGGTIKMCDVYAFSCEEVRGETVIPEKMAKLDCPCVNEMRVAHALRAEERRQRRPPPFGAVPPALAGVTFGKLNAGRNMRARQAENYASAVRACREYSITPYERPLLTIFGPVGSGKTTLAAAIVNARGMDTVWAYIVDLLKHLQSTFGAVGEFSYAVEFQRIVESPLLVLDDLGAEKTTEWTMQELDHIVTHRHMHRLPTVITTNLDMTQQSGRIGSRLRDWKASELVRLDVSDFRIGARR